MLHYYLKKVAGDRVNSLLDAAFNLFWVQFPAPWGHISALCGGSLIPRLLAAGSFIFKKKLNRMKAELLCFFSFLHKCLKLKIEMLYYGV
jgi:hypothetical protein